jgi:uncharacterized protein DUF3352
MGRPRSAALTTLATLTPHLVKLKIHMKFKNRLQRFVILIGVLVLLASPLSAQQRRTAPPKKQTVRQVAQPIPTFDNLFAADSYRIYAEVRGVGALISSPAIKDLLAPMMKLGGPPQEFKTALKWLNAHAEVLAGSRMLVAGWPARPKLPTILIAIEFASTEEAQKFEPELRGFIPTLLPTPTPTPAALPDKTKPDLPASSIPPKQEEPAPPPYQMKQAGSLVLLSDQQFDFRDLTPRGSKSMTEDQNFTMARNRFASEAIFVYVDVKSIEKEDAETRRRGEEERLRAEKEAANSPKEEEAETAPETGSVPEIVRVEEPPPPVEPEPSSSPQIGRTDEQIRNGATLQAVQPNPLDFAFQSLSGLLFGGQPKWPEAVGAAIAFEDDGYVVRTLLVNGEDNKNNSIPFIPQFKTGPALVPASPGIFPDDTDVLVALSLDYEQIYQGMLKTFADNEEASRESNSKRRANPGSSEPNADRTPETPFTILEKKLGVKIKDDILPLLGNEIALAMKSPAALIASQPSTAAANKSANTAQERPVSPEQSPIIAISVKDKEGVKRLIPKIIESLGMKGANLLAQTEKRGETEIVSYAGVFSYAFIGDFLVVSTDPAAARHVADSYLEHQTLSSNSHFRNATRWQPRQVQGQVYLGPDLVERYNPITGTAGIPVNEKMQEFLSQVNPVIDPVTYALSNDGMGPFHELHVPKSLLVLLTAGIASGINATPLTTNESIAKSLLQTVASAETTFQSGKGAGRYGTLDELVSEGLVTKDLFKKYGYKIEVTVSLNRFEAVAVPVEYGTTGRMSYFVDESGILRGGDHGGGTATIADKPVE